MDPFRGYANAIHDGLPDAVGVVDPFHIVRLGTQVVDEVRRRVQQDTLGRRGHTPTPCIRSAGCSGTAWGWGPNRPRVSRAAIAERGGWLCKICGLPVGQALTYPDPMHQALDHIVPVTEGAARQPQEKSSAVNREYGRAITAGFTTACNHTAEPTVLAAIYADYILAFNELVIRDFPFNGGPDNAVSTGFALRLTALATVNVRATFRFERC